MNWIHLKKSDPTVRQIIAASFPAYNGQHIVAVITDSITFYGTMWDEGTKREYTILRLADMKRMEVPMEPFMSNSPAHHKPFPIPEGFVVVVYSIGRLDRIEIHANASAVTPLLPAPISLTEDEEIVLMATAGLKSSYGGIKNYRFYEANQKTGITLERWEAAKANLIGRNLLTKVGAITADGRNTVGSKRL